MRTIIGKYNCAVKQEMDYQTERSNKVWSYEDRKKFKQAFKKWCKNSGSKMAIIGAVAMAVDGNAIGDEFRANAEAWIANPTDSNELDLIMSINNISGGSPIVSVIQWGKLPIR